MLELCEASSTRSENMVRVCVILPLSLSLFWFHLLCFFIFILLLCSEHQYDQYALPGSADGGHQRNKVLDNDTHAELKTDAPKISMLSLRVGT